VEVIGNLLDIPRDERGPLRGWSLATLSALEPSPSAERVAQGQQAVTEFLDYLRGLVAQRAARPGDPETDVLTRLMQGDASGRLDERELLHNCIFLLNAGHETTTNLIGNGAWLLMTHRDERARLLAEPALINPAVEELLRLESPIQINNRLATAAIPLPSGTTLPAGTYINLAIGAANRDPARFDDPERIDIARKPNNHLAFGQGAHACSGMNVARMEARIALLKLFQRFPQLDLAGPPDRDRRLRFRGFRALPVRCG
jgi:cytochrome P450